MVRHMFSAWIADHKRAYIQSMLLAYKKPIATSANLLLISSTLTLLVLSWVIMNGVDNWAVRWRQGGASIAVYLSMSSSSQDVDDLLVQLRATPDVLNVVQISPVQGLAELKKKQGMQSLLHDLPKNPLPIVINITPSQQIDTTLKLKNLYNKLKKYPHIKHSTLDLEWLEQVQDWVMSFMQIMCLGMMLVGFMLLLNIGQSLRIMVSERSSDIGLLLQMGAAEQWIMRPFLYLGGAYGFISAGLAGLAIEIICYAANHALRESSMLLSWKPEYLAFSLKELMVFVIVTTCLSVSFAFIFVRSHLKGIDCLGRT